MTELIYDQAFSEPSRDLECRTTIFFTKDDEGNYDCIAAFSGKRLLIPVGPDLLIEAKGVRVSWSDFKITYDYLVTEAPVDDDKTHFVREYLAPPNVVWCGLDREGLLTSGTFSDVTCQRCRVGLMTSGLVGVKDGSTMGWLKD